MTPEPVTDEMVQALSSPLAPAVKHTFVGDAESPNVSPCDGVVHVASDGQTAVIRVPMRLEPDELRRLLCGGTVWVSMFGGLSPFAVEVVSHPDDTGAMPNAQKALHQQESAAREQPTTDTVPDSES